MKPPVDRLKKHVEDWTVKLNSAIPRCVYHFTGIENAIAILKRGELLSRQACVDAGVQHFDSASPQVIDNTPAEIKRYVRLYFGPKTPTQWHSEGIRPPVERTPLDAHCPVPVFFLFDLVEVLSQQETCFSNGNTASLKAERGDSLELFDSIPFESVYHRGLLSEADRSAVRFHRHAEVLVPDSLSMNGLVKLVCRSHAERRTILSLLDADRRQKFSRPIEIGGAEFFNRDWAFVDRVEGAPNQIVFHLTFRQSQG